MSSKAPARSPPSERSADEQSAHAPTTPSLAALVESRRSRRSRRHRQRVAIERDAERKGDETHRETEQLSVLGRPKLGMDSTRLGNKRAKRGRTWAAVCIGLFGDDTSDDGDDAR